MKNYIKIFFKKEENNNKTIKRHIIKKNVKEYWIKI